jgi:hypothetical protein
MYVINRDHLEVYTCNSVIKRNTGDLLDQNLSVRD